jgi:hypothetical protein
MYHVDGEIVKEEGSFVFIAEIGLIVAWEADCQLGISN